MRRATILAAVILGSMPPTLAQEACPPPGRDESIALARQFHEEVINRRNPAVLDQILADTVRHHAAGGYPDEMDAAGVKAMMADFLDAFPDLAYSFDLWAVDGDLVVERYTATGTQEGPLGDIAPTGRKASWTGVNIFRIDCGRIVELWSEVDALSRNRQLTE
jgi:predicted ester cyclase